MSRVTLVTAFVLCISCVMQAQIVLDKRYSDARALHDMATLPFDRIAKEGNETWVVAQLNPAPYSGSAKIAGSPPQLRTYSHGTWDALVSLRHAPGITHGNYTCEQLLTYHGRELDIDSVYDPLDKGGLVLCRILEGSTPVGVECTELYLVPTEWKSFVAPAYVTYVQEVAGPSPSRKEEQDALVSLLDAGNPVLSLLAFRRLAQDQSVAISVLINAVKRSNGTLAASSGYVLLTEKRFDTELITSQIRGIASESNGSGKLESLTRSVFAAALFHGKEERTATLCSALVPVISRSVSNTEINAGERATVRSILSDIEVMLQ